MKIRLFDSTTSKQIELLNKELNKSLAQSKEASRFIREIEKGNFETEVSDKFSESELGVSLSSLKSHLIKIAEEEKIRNWHNTGIAAFSDILRNKNSLSLDDLAYDILSNLINYLSANQGALFIMESEGDTKPYLKMISCFAYNRKKYLHKRINTGEGLAGQCALEKQYIYLKEIPKNYVNITSGLGEAAPGAILISPLIVNDTVFGVIEIATLSEFKLPHIDFVNRISENIAASIKSLKDNERTISLLNSSQKQALELKQQEEQLKLNVEMLNETQNNIKIILAEKTFDLQVREEVFGVTSILSEADLRGNIIYANAKLSLVSQYTIDEMMGKPHSLFRHPDMPKSLFKLFWETLKKGETFKGIIKNKAKDGSHYWVDGCFVPVKDDSGCVIKYVGARYHITDDDIAVQMYNKQAEKLGFPLL